MIRTTVWFERELKKLSKRHKSLAVDYRQLLASLEEDLRRERRWDAVHLKFVWQLHQKAVVSVVVAVLLPTFGTRLICFT